jgi:hypothetical protein
VRQVQAEECDLDPGNTDGEAGDFVGSCPSESPNPAPVESPGRLSTLLIATEVLLAGRTKDSGSWRNNEIGDVHQQRNVQFTVSDRRERERESHNLHGTFQRRF